MILDARKCPLASGLQARVEGLSCLLLWSALTAERIEVRSLAGAVLKIIRTTFARSSAGTTYWVNWKAPGHLFGRFRFCVEAWDQVGNTSAPSCASLHISRG